MKVLKVILIIGGVIVLLAVIAMGYLGYIPAVSKVLGTNTPRDLGVTYTEADLASAKNKFGVELAETGTKDPTGSISYEGSHLVNTSFTDEELTAMVASKRYIYNPVKNVQIKIGGDGKLESSGLLVVSNLDNYFAAVAPGTVSSAEVAKYTKLLPGEVPYYITGTASVSGGNVSVKLDTVEIARSPKLGNLVARAYANNASANVSEFSVGPFNIPSSTLSSYQARINTFLTTRLNRITGLQAKSVTFSGGKMNFDGSMPNKKTRAVK